MVMIDLSSDQSSLLTYNVNPAKVSRLSQICKAQFKVIKLAKKASSRSKMPTKNGVPNVYSTPQRANSSVSSSLHGAESDSLSQSQGVASETAEVPAVPVSRFRVAAKKKKRRRQKKDETSIKNFFWKLYADYYKENPKLQKLNH